MLFSDFKLNKQLHKAISDLGFKEATPIQAATFSEISSGKDVVGIAQTGTGKTLAYLLPLLRDFPYSNQKNPRILILVPTRELVIQVVGVAKELTKYMHRRLVGVYGGVNLKTQGEFLLEEGADIVVATPGRLYDLLVERFLSLKDVRKLVIDEVDVMLDLGFSTQMARIFDFLPEKKQSILFSATITDEINQLIEDVFVQPKLISTATSGIPLENIKQSAYRVKNFHTKVNLLVYLLEDVEQFKKVIVFSSGKKKSDLIFSLLGEKGLESEIGVVHSNKSQNYRLRTIEDFDRESFRILISTDVTARGIDLSKVTHVINFDTPEFPENYIHRIGRTGRAEEKGEAILFFTEKEKEYKENIEELLGIKIPEKPFPKNVEVSNELLPEEKEKTGIVAASENRKTKIKLDSEGAFHEKKQKNKKKNLGGSYKRKIKSKYKKPKTRGDKTYHKKRRKKNK